MYRLIVNEHLNVRKDYVRQIGAMLHSWRKFGLDEAGKRFIEAHDRRNRARTLQPTDFRFVVRGRVQFVGAVKGWNDPVYNRLAASLFLLDQTFKPKTGKTTTGKTLVFVEGKTHSIHLRPALSSLHR